MPDSAKPGPDLPGLPESEKRRFVELVRSNAVILERVVLVPLSGPQADYAQQLPEDLRIMFHRLCSDFRSANRRWKQPDTIDFDVIASIIICGWRWLPSSERGD